MSERRQGAGPRLLVAVVAIALLANPAIATAAGNTVDAGEVANATANVSSYHVSATVDARVGEKRLYAEMEGDLNKTEERFNGSILLKGAANVDAQVYLTDSRMYFQRASEDEWCWTDEGVGDAFSRAQLTQFIDLLQNGSIESKSAATVDGEPATVFVVDPTDSQVAAWLAGEDTDITITRAEYRITVLNETARIHSVDVDAEGYADGKTFELAGSQTFTRYNAIGSIELPDGAADAERSTALTRVQKPLMDFTESVVRPAILGLLLIAMGFTAVFELLGFLFGGGESDE